MADTTLTQKLETPVELRMVLLKEEGGPSLDSAPIKPVDFNDACSEVWFNECLPGDSQLQFDEYDYAVLPIVGKEDGKRCLGFRIEARRDGQTRGHRLFTIYALGVRAGCVAQSLRKAGLLEGLDKYFYEVQIADEIGADTSPLMIRPGFSPSGRRIHRGPLAVLELPIEPLRRASKPVDMDLNADAYPVFYTQQAHDQARDFSQRGLSRDPPEESGAMLVAVLCRSPDGEVFAVVVGASEALNPESAQFSLSYTGESWKHVETDLKRWQSLPHGDAFRLVGQAHGHNWNPCAEGGKCSTCDKKKDCSVSTAWLSLDDKNWMKSVFNTKPYQLAHTFGISVSGDTAEALYGLDGGILSRRGYHLIAELDEETKSRIGLANH